MLPSEGVCTREIVAEFTGAEMRGTGHRRLKKPSSGGSSGPMRDGAVSGCGGGARGARIGQSGSATVRSTSTSCPAKPSCATPKSVLAEVKAGPRAEAVSRCQARPRSSLSSLRT